SRRSRHTMFSRDWSSDVCSSDLARRGERERALAENVGPRVAGRDLDSHRVAGMEPVSAVTEHVSLVELDGESRMRPALREGRFQIGRASWRESEDGPAVAADAEG